MLLKGFFLDYVVLVEDILKSMLVDVSVLPQTVP